VKIDQYLAKIRTKCTSLAYFFGPPCRSVAVGYQGKYFTSSFTIITFMLFYSCSVTIVVAACACVRVQWIFGMPMNRSRQYTSDEIEFAEVIMRYWTNFAKTG